MFEKIIIYDFNLFWLSKFCQNSAHEAISILQADAEMLSAMFRKQVKQNVDQADEGQQQDFVVQDLQNVLKSERNRTKYTKDELNKKEMLVVRAMAACTEAQKSYREEKQKVHAANEEVINYSHFYFIFNDIKILNN